MIGILLILGVTYCLLRIEHKGLGALGFDAPARRARELSVGLVAAAAFVAVQQAALALAGGFAWERNPEFTLAAVLRGVRFDAQSVVLEELVFRGYPLYRAIRWLGERRGVWSSAVAFGVYHWFSYGVIGSPVPMVFVFLLTGGAGLLFATAFARTGSLALPLGLHLGWNLVTNTVFSNGPLGDLWLVPVPPDGPESSGTAAALALKLALPLAFVALALWRLRSVHAPSAHDSAAAR